MQQVFRQGRRARRSVPSGQGIIEGVAGTLLITFVFVFLIMLGLNVYSSVVYSQKLQFVANVAAHAYNQQHFWLGTIRPTFNEAEATRNGERVASELLQQLNLPPAKSITFKNVMGENYSYTEANLTVGGLKIPYGINKVFPSVVELNATGLAAEASYTPYASYIMNVPIDGQVDQFGRTTTRKFQSVFLAAYGFATLDGNLPGTSGKPTAFGGPGRVVPGGDVFVAGANVNGGSPTFIEKINTSTGAKVRLPYQ